MNAETQAQSGDLKTAVKHAMHLLSAGEAGLAREQAEEILRHYPGEVNSEFVVAAAIRAQGHEQDALRRLQVLVERADRKSTRLNSSHSQQSRMPSSA